MTNALLKSIDFIRSDDKLTSGLVPVEESIDKELTVDEQAVIFEAMFFKRVDFVFFRRFSDYRSSQIAAYVVDNSDETLSDSELSELHRKVWLQGKTPLLYVARQSRIDVLACARKPDFWDKRKKDYIYKPAK